MSYKLIKRGTKCHAGGLAHHVDATMLDVRYDDTDVLLRLPTAEQISVSSQTAESVQYLFCLVMIQQLRNVCAIHRFASQMLRQRLFALSL